ncbi:MAG: hypothetical protein QXN90_07160 [Zestosphaera sp.]
MSEFSYGTQRGWLAGFYRASKYLVIATLLESILFFSLLWWLIGVYLSSFFTGERNFFDLGREFPLLLLSPQIQLITLGFMIGFLMWLYAVFGEMIPSLRELENQGVNLGASLTMVFAGTVATLTLAAIQLTISLAIYLILSNITVLIVIYSLSLGVLVTNLLVYVGFFLIFDKLGHVLNNKRFVIAGVLVLISAFIFFLGPVAWFISFVTVRNILSTTI